MWAGAVAEASYGRASMIRWTEKRVRRVALERLERCDGKPSRTDLRGGSGREVTPLPGNSPYRCRPACLCRGRLHAKRCSAVPDLYDRPESD